jgi:Modifier of rudimentary (Mod(r)) protein
LAKENLRHETEIQELHATITQLQAELQTKVKAFQDLEKKQDKLCQPPPISKVIRELTKATKDAFQQSEQLADKWLQQSGSDSKSTETFIEEFIAARKKQHIRAAKLELLERKNTTITR